MKMFRKAESESDFLKALCVRSIVFIHEQNCPYNEEVDGLDNKALHIIGEDNGEPFACGRIRFADNFAKLERIAVRKEWRGSGSGKELVLFMMEKVYENDYKFIKMNAQLHAVSFYEQLGFSASGDVFMEAGIEHILMTKNSIE